MVKILSLETKKLPHETNMEFIHRLCEIKEDLNLTWRDIADIASKEVGYHYSESWYRKNYKSGMFMSMSSNVTYSTSDDNCSESNSELLDLQMKKVELRDIVTQNNAYIRRLSREQTIKDIAKYYSETMNKEKLLNTPLSNMLDISSTEGILLLSDWHYGMVCDNSWNKFDPEICKSRVSKLLTKVIELVKKNEIYHVTVLDLSDLIAGRIHTQIRIESRYDVITQTMDVCEILAEFLSELSKYCLVSFYSCLDNHSRVEPNKRESLDLESLVRLIPWYLKERLSNNTHVSICDNEFGEDIITCKVNGHNIIGVHGDNDKPTSALERLSLLTHDHYDMLCTAHLHHFSMDERTQSIIVGNGSLMGVDTYAVKLRVSSIPSQTFIVSTKENVCECVYKLNL